MPDESIFYRKSRTDHRVVVTGIGALCPTGLNAEDIWKNALGGLSGIDKITRFNAENFDSQIAGEVKNFPVAQYIPHKDQKKMDPFIQYSVATTKMALENSSLDIKKLEPHKIGVIIGSGIGGLSTIEKQFETYLARGPSRISPFFIPSVIANMSCGQIALIFGAQGVNLCMTSACASGAHAIGEAAGYIRRGLCDVMIAGGTEASITPLAVGGFSAMRALSTRNTQPQLASRPFDQDRDGFVLAEGAATLILESYEHASHRGANIYAELCGYGVSCDASHMAAPAQDGHGAIIAMKLALQDARLNPNDIEYINAHGTSTPLGDEIESQAVEVVFEDHAKHLAISSTKSMTGHLLGAAGAVESVFCLKALKHQVVPPTINLDKPAEGCHLDYVPYTARDMKLNNVMNNSFGFGGTNATLIFSRLI